MKTNQNQNQEATIFNAPYSNGFVVGNLNGRIISFIDSNLGVVAYAGKVIRTEDGGNNWIVTDYSADTSSLQYLVTVNANKWVVMGGYGELFITENRGGILTDIPDVLAKNALAIYPNPASDKIMGKFATNGEKVTGQIIAPDGRIIISNIPIAQNSFEIDVAPLAVGLYFLVLHDEKQQWVQKFVKE